MNTRFYISLSLLLFMFSSCSRTPEQILSRNWGINVNKIEHRVDSFKDKWYPNGDGECEVKLHIVLSNKDLEQLVSQGAQPLPITEEPNLIDYLERLSGIKGASNGVYYYKPEGSQAPLEHTFLIYDKDSQTLFYHLSLM